jgi:propanol-preferring alcohol dehydrogenase
MTDIPTLRYADHLFQERQVRSVTANTRRDGEELLAIARRIPLRIATTPYHLHDADQALDDLAHDRVTGAAVLLVP